ncbi:MAG: N-6 DNA methylase [Gammaproteobacteria bacterium]|nr:N-6 DNA methylase [Gammaproteobacteria bacterium]
MSKNLEKIILQHSVEMAECVSNEAEGAQSEEDIRIACSISIKDFITKLGIKLTGGRHEYRAGQGRIDSKYGHLIIEFKNPQGNKKLTNRKNSAGAREVRSQIKDRFNSLNAEENVQLTRMLGVGLDGRHILYIQHDGKKFLEEAPQEVNHRSLERLLRALVSIGARGLSFTPSNLARHFAASSSSAKKCVKVFYELISSAKKNKAEVMFRQWETMFGEVCGFDITQHKIKGLADSFQLKNCDARRLLFAIHTYYSVFMKLLSAQILVAMSDWMTSPIQQILRSESSNRCRTVLSEIERGGIWAQIGIRNFLEGDLFSWYLDVWDEQCDEGFRKITTTLNQFDPYTLSVEPQESRDLLKQLYQELVPRTIRHDLGEYYTPDWVAELVFSEIGYSGDPNTRLLDPACGSGTFLVLAIAKVRQWFSNNRTTCGFDERVLVRKILENIIGFDLNPLAVMAARTNYLIAIRDLISDLAEVDLPVHLCDSLLSRGDLSDELPHEQVLTAVGTFTIPEEVTHTARDLTKYSHSLEHCVQNEYPVDEFLDYCDEGNLSTINRHAHETLYNKLVSLNEENKNGIWARIIKNAFAPLFVGKVDYVIGNPPWVNWEHLPKDYRSATTSLWVNYGLFNLRHGQHRLGGSKKDLSMLFTYFCLDQYLENGGRLGFVITNSVFKSKHAGSGFRRFMYTLGDNQTNYIKVDVVHDFSRKTVFDGVANETAVLICTRSRTPHSWPITCVEWFGNPKKIPETFDYDEIKSKFTHATRKVHPVDRSDLTSPWLTASQASLSGLLKLQGSSQYSFKVGVNTMGLISVYWVEYFLKHLTETYLFEIFTTKGRSM